MLSSALDEAIAPTTDFVRSPGVTYVTPPELTENAEWMREAIRQFQAVAPAHATWLKRQTGLGWKLFKHVLTENGRLIFRFDLARRQDMTRDPMIVIRLAYSLSADLYNAQVEVWRSVGQMIVSHETSDADIDTLQDPERFYLLVRHGLAQLGRTEETTMAELSSDLRSALTEGPDADDVDHPDQVAARAASKRANELKTPEAHRDAAAAHRKAGNDASVGAHDEAAGRMERRAAPKKKFKKLAKADRNSPEQMAAKSARQAERAHPGMKMVFGKWVKAEGTEPDGADIYELDETVIGKPVDLSEVEVDMGGPGMDRINPTKSGPAAERTAMLKKARTGIERMMSALDTVRTWLAPFHLGDKDKSGAARAALMMARDEIAKVEDIQGDVGSMFEMGNMNLGAAIASMDEAVAYIEAKKEQSPEAVKAKEGLTRMVDGLRQLHGMLRQAKLSGRILDAVDAAINGLKVTRDAINAMAESMGSGSFERMKASQIRNGYVVRGGTQAEPVYRKVTRILRQEEDMAYVILDFDSEYVGSDGQLRSTARFHKDASVMVSRG